jgi:hypothetical protein
MTIQAITTSLSPSAPRRQLIVLIHGIRTRETATAWQEQLQLYIDDSADPAVQMIHTIHKEYWAGIVPTWNVFVENPFYARALRDLIVPYFNKGFEVSFICHSNGADIGSKTINLLAAQGYQTKAFLTIAGAIHADVEKNGIASLIRTGKLKRAIAYCSGWDRVLGAPIIIWPYGRLGLTGFQLHGRTFIGGDGGFSGDQIRNRFFPGFDHCTYFLPPHETATFNQAIADCTAPL